MKILDFQIDKKLYKDVIGTVYSLNPDQNESAGLIKILHEDLSHQDDLKEYFHLCSEKCCSISNEHYVNALSHGQENDIHFLVYEKSSLVPLSQLLAKATILSISDAIAIIETLANILRNAHIDELVHGHISPQTIFSHINLKQLKITDFGFDEFIRALIAKNKYQELLEGLPFYSPEFIVGTGPFGRQADIYSLGVIFYRLLVGEAPWINQGLEEFLQKPYERSAVPPSLKRLEVPDFLDDLILSALEPNIEKRCPNLSEFLKGIAEVKAKFQALLAPTTETRNAAAIDEADDVPESKTPPTEKNNTASDHVEIETIAPRENSRDHETEPPFPGGESGMADPSHSPEAPETREESVQNLLAAIDENPSQAFAQATQPESEAPVAAESSNRPSEDLHQSAEQPESLEPKPGDLPHPLDTMRTDQEERGPAAPLSVNSNGESTLENQKNSAAPSPTLEDTTAEPQGSAAMPPVVPELQEDALENERPGNPERIDLSGAEVGESAVPERSITEPKSPDRKASITASPDSGLPDDRSAVEASSAERVVDDIDSSEKLQTAPSVVKNFGNKESVKTDMNSTPAPPENSEPAALPSFEFNVQLSQEETAAAPQLDSQDQKDVYAHDEIRHPSELKDGAVEKLALNEQTEPGPTPLQSNNSQIFPVSRPAPNLSARKGSYAGAPAPFSVPRLDDTDKAGVPFTPQDEGQTEFKFNRKQSLKFYKKQLTGRSFWVVLKGFLFVLIPVLAIYLLIAITFDLKLTERFAGLKEQLFGDHGNASGQTTNQQQSANPQKNSRETGGKTDPRVENDSAAPQRTNRPVSSADARLTLPTTDRAAQPSQLNVQVSVVGGQRAQIAEVYLNGNYYGRTNQQGRLLLSNLNQNTSYLVKVQKQGFAMWAREVSFKTPGTKNLNVNLTSRPGTSTPTRASANQGTSTLTVLLSNPQNVSYGYVYINGELWQGGDNIAPAKIQLPPGRYQVEVKRDGYKTHPPSSSLALIAGESKTIYFYLIPN
ncbi:MAG: PEGA domain-containing protein [bacterium]